MNSSEQLKLHSWAHEYGIELTPHQIELLGLYLDELWEWNKKINLTGLTSRNKIIKELLLDSMIPSAFLPDQGKLLDVGSGAGFPGIPLMICKPKLSALFLEPISKRASFLKQVIRITKLSGIDVIRGRIEKSKDLLFPEGYHIVTARALAHLPQVLELCAPHLAPGGLLINFQGDQFKQVLEESSDMIKKHALSLHKTIPYSLPGKRTKRNILIFRKTQPVRLAISG